MFVAGLEIDGVPHWKALGVPKSKPLTLEVVEQSVRSLAWGKRHEVVATPRPSKSEGSYLRVQVGNAGGYLCTLWTEADGELVCVTRKKKSKATSEVRNAEGEESLRPVNCFVSLDDALSVARRYVANGEPLDGMKWEPIESAF